jgi:hypothetical protein
VTLRREPKPETAADLIALAHTIVDGGKLTKEGVLLSIADATDLQILLAQLESGLPDDLEWRQVTKSKWVLYQHGKPYGGELDDFLSGIGSD